MITKLLRGYSPGIGLLLTCGLSCSAPGAAAVLPWTVNGLFANGQSLSGTFDFDATTSMASAWNLSALGYTYTPATSTFSSGQCCSDQFDFMFSTSGDVLTLDFAFNPDLTDAGGSSSIAGGAVTFYLSPDVSPTIEELLSGTAVSGTGSTPPPVIGPPPPPVTPPTPDPSAVPEPQSLLLLGGGLIMVALRRVAVARQKN